MSRRRLPAVLAVAVSATVVGVFAPTSSSASCVGPMPTVGPVTLGHDVEVDGEWFRTGCDDTGGSGCGGVTSTEVPMEDVEIVLDQGGTSWTLATVDAGGRGENYAIHWSGPLPDGVSAGAATVTAGGVPVDVVVGG